MFNEYNNNQIVDIKPACTGMLQKSHPKSYFKWFHLDSEFRRISFDNNPRVLQFMTFGDKNVIAEFLPQDEYEKWIESKESNNN